MTWKSVGDMYAEHAKAYPGRKHIISCDDDTGLTYGEMQERIERLCSLFARQGIEKGDTVSFLLESSIELVIGLFACWSYGAAANPLNISLSAEELLYLLKDSGAKMLFVNEEQYKKVAQGLKGHDIAFVGLGFSEGNAISYDDAMKDTAGWEPQKPTLDDVALIIYSSGTTAKPKGVMLTQGDLLAEGAAIAEVAGADEKTVVLDSLPLFFIGGIMPTLFTATVAGGTVVINKKFSRSRFWERVERYRVQWTLLVPTMTSFLLNPPEDVSKRDLSCFRFIFSSAAPLPVELLRRFEETFGFPVYETYGLSENTAWATMTPVEKARQKPGSVGIPMPGVSLAIMDDGGNTLGDDAVGEVVIRGPIVMKGYLNLPKLTEETIVQGWLHTGDLGYRDKDGYYYIVDRKKDLIIKGGENISPKEIDNVLYMHEAVADAAAIGVPDPMYGEEIVAYVVVKEGMHAGEEDILSHCKSHLARHKCPKEIIFAESIPKGASGKLLRRQLREDWLVRDKRKV